MRIVKRRIIKKEGFVQLVPTEDEDLWHIYNLIEEGDHIKALTTRKIVNVSQSGVKNAVKKTLVLTLQIVKISYHHSDHLALEIKGQNVQKNDFLSLNQYHTFSIELDSPLTIIKNNWYGYHFKILKEISDPSNDTDVAAMVMDEGIAHLCYVKSSLTLLKQKVEKSIPKKRAGADKHQAEMTKFYQYCFEAFMLLDFKQISCFIIASPGFVKDDFLKYIKDKSLSEQYSSQFKQLQILQKIIAVRSSSGYLNGLNDALQDPAVMTRLQDTKAIKQIKIFDEFYQELSRDENKVAYSEKSVVESYRQNAIKKLLISDSLFRTKDLQKRKFFNSLVDNVAKQGGETYIFSSLHKSGEKLNTLSGIAAILKFPVVQDDEDSSDDSDSEEEQKKTEKVQKKKDIFEGIDISDDYEDEDEEGNDGGDSGDTDEIFEKYQQEIKVQESEETKE